MALARAPMKVLGRIMARLMEATNVSCITAVNVTKAGGCIELHNGSN